MPGRGARRHPDGRRRSRARDRLESAIERLNQPVMQLPDKLHRDFYEVLLTSQRQYQTSRVIVWTSALMVLAMLCGLAALFHRWVLYPVRLLHRGVRRVAGGRSTTRSSSRPATRCRSWPRRSTT